MNDRKTILVVEDNPDMQTIYKDMLEQHKVIISGNTTDALEKLRKKGIDLMILDIVLPKERGDEFFERIKRTEEFKDLKVICVSVLDDVARKMKAIDPGVRFLAKPFSKKDLLQMV